ncbi:MAG TPA: hypothetical protein VJA21_12550 [Verrucomicrobiae bacterium]
MRNRGYSILTGLGLVLATGGTSFAESELVSIFIEPEWPTTANPGNVVTYTVTAVSRVGQGLLEVALTCGGLPEGTTVSFSPNVLRFTGRVPVSLTSTLTITSPTVMPIDSYPFTVTGTAQRQTVVYTNQTVAPFSGPPVLVIDSLADGSFMIRGRGVPGETFQIETTPDLANSPWAPIGTTTADGNGRFVFLPAQPNDTPARFYRAVRIPQN